MNNQSTALMNVTGTSRSASPSVRGVTPASRLAHIGKWLLPLFLAGCAAYSGSSLKPGISSLEEVLAVMGPPAQQWTNPDHTIQLSYPKGPSGTDSYMAYVNASGRLERIDNVMTEASFAKVKANLTQEEVLRILGPSVPAWTVSFPARRELAWEWRYCSEAGMLTRFDVIFNSDTGRVRSTQSQAETCVGTCKCAN